MSPGNTVQPVMKSTHDALRQTRLSGYSTYSIILHTHTHILRLTRPHPEGAVDDQRVELALQSKCIHAPLLHGDV